MCLLVYPKTQNQINVLTTLFKEMNIDFEYNPLKKRAIFLMILLYKL